MKASRWATAMWTDRSFFQSTVNLVFGSLADKVPQDFIADREKLRGAKFDVAAMTSASRRCAISFARICNGSRPSLPTAAPGWAATTPVFAMSTPT